MFVYYEVFNENPLKPEEELYEFVLSSDGRSNAISFSDKIEKTNHTIITQFFKQIPLDVREYDAKTFVTQLIGLAGKRIVTVLETACTNGLLQSTKIKKITNLQTLLAQKNLCYVEPKKPKARDGQVEIKFNEEDFFYKPAISKGELSGEALWNALATMLCISVVQLQSESSDKLKKLYRQRAMLLHPDRNNGDGAGMAELNRLWALYNAS